MKGEVKERILSVASELFYTKGYNVTGINEIIEKSDIARGSLYNHYKSKADLLIAYLKQADQSMFAEIDALLKPLKTPKEKLLALLEYRLARQQRNGFGGCAFVKISSEIDKDETEVLSLVAINKEKLRRLIHTLVQQVNHRKLLTDELLTETIFLLTETASLHGVITKKSWSMDRAKEIVQKLL